MLEVCCDGSILLKQESLNLALELFDELYYEDYAIIRAVLPYLPEGFNLKILDNTIDFIPNYIQKAMKNSAIKPIKEYKALKPTDDSNKLIMILLKKQMEFKNIFFRTDEHMGEIIITNKDDYAKVLHMETLRKSVDHIIPLIAEGLQMLEFLKNLQLECNQIIQFIIPKVITEKYMIQEIKKNIQRVHKLYCEHYNQKNIFNKKIMEVEFNKKVDGPTTKFFLYGLYNGDFISLIWIIK